MPHKSFFFWVSILLFLLDNNYHSYLSLTSFRLLSRSLLAANSASNAWCFCNFEGRLLVLSSWIKSSFSSTQSQSSSASCMKACSLRLSLSLSRVASAASRLALTSSRTTASCRLSCKKLKNFATGWTRRNSSSKKKVQEVCLQNCRSIKHSRRSWLPTGTDSRAWKRWVIDSCGNCCPAGKGELILKKRKICEAYWNLSNYVGNDISWLWMDVVQGKLKNGFHTVLWMSYWKKLKVIYFI